MYSTSGKGSCSLIFCCSPENHVKVIQESCTRTAKFSLEQIFKSCCIDSYCEKKEVVETLKVEITCLTLYFYPSSVERDKCTLPRAGTCSQDSWLPS